MGYWLAGMLVAATASAPSGQLGTVSEKELHATVETYLAAYRQLDMATMDRMETDDFIFVQDGRVATKTQQMASLKAPGRKANSLKFDLAFGDGWVVADSAVLTGSMTVTGEDGKPLKGAFTYLLRRTRGEWRVQHAHHSTERAVSGPSR